MRKIVLLLIVFVMTGYSRAQDVKTEVQSSATIYDSKENSDSVPSVYAINGKFERVMVVRLKNKTDLLSGIEKAVRENNIKNAVILAGIGSVTSYHYHVVGNTGFPPKNIFIENQSAPADIASMNGYIIDGRVHAHAAFANADKSFGGHLEPGTSVFTFAIVTIGVLSDSTDLSHVDDWNYR